MGGGRGWSQHLRTIRTMQHGSSTLGTCVGGTARIWLRDTSAALRCYGYLGSREASVVLLFLRTLLFIRRPPPSDCDVCTRRSSGWLKALPLFPALVVGRPGTLGTPSPPPPASSFRAKRLAKSDRRRFLASAVLTAALHPLVRVLLAWFWVPAGKKEAGFRQERR